jgi:hypothetical protein
LKGAVFGLPWLSFWKLAPPNQQQQLLSLLSLIESAGATIINGTELPYWQTIVSPDGWNWDYGTTRGYPNESEYTYVKVDFYNDIAKYLAELNNTEIRSLADIVQYNIDNVGSEGGIPNVHPAFQSGQDGSMPLSPLEESWMKPIGRRSPSVIAQQERKASMRHCLITGHNSLLYLYLLMSHKLIRLRLKRVIP